MKNKIHDLRNHLFEQLERLNDDSLTDEELEREAFRAESMTNIASVIVQSAKVEVDFIKAVGLDDKSSTFLMPEQKNEALAITAKKK